MKTGELPLLHGALGMQHTIRPTAALQVPIPSRGGRLLVQAPRIRPYGRATEDAILEVLEVCLERVALMGVRLREGHEGIVDFIEQVDDDKLIIGEKGEGDRGPPGGGAATAISSALSSRGCGASSGGWRSMSA